MRDTCSQWLARHLLPRNLAGKLLPRYWWLPGQWLSRLAWLSWLEWLTRLPR